MRLRLCIAIAALGILAVPASADGYIFWISYDSGKSKVGRAGLDASGFNPELVGDIYFGAGVATDGKYVYWGESGSNPKLAEIGRATVDGAEPNHAFQSGATYCSIFGIRALASDIYWLKNDCSGASINTRIDKATNAGGQGFYSEPGAGSSVCGFAVDANYVYWSEGHYIARAPNVYPPQLPDKTWLDLGVGHSACGVAVDGAHVYWTTLAPYDPETFRADAIGRASIDGSEASVENDFIVNASFFTSVSTPSGIDVDGSFIYWTNQPPSSSVVGSIGRANLDGTGVDYDFVPNVFYPFGIDVEGGGPAPAPPSPGGKTKRPPPPPMRIVVVNSNNSFAPGSGSTAVRFSSGLASPSKGVPRGTVFTYTLNQEAAVTVEMKRVKAGRLVGKKCKRPTKATAKKKKCDLTEQKLFRKGKEGKNTLPYSGRVKGKALAVGKYKAAFTAKAPGGKPKSDSVAFRIVRP